MKKVFMIFFIGIISFTTFKERVYADICDNADIQRLKELANIVDVSYEYIENSSTGNSEDDSWIDNMYYVFVSNLNEELYIKKGTREYYYSDVKDGVLQFIQNSGTIQLVIYSNACSGKVLRTINLELPKFNTYSYRQECNDLAELNLDFCDEWYQGYLDDRIFDSLIEPYINGDISEVTFFDRIIQLLRQYYIFIILGLLVIVGIILFWKNYRKRSVLE